MQHAPKPASRQAWRRLSALCLGLLWLFAAPALAAQTPPPQILILHSYNPEMTWTAGIMAGMGEALATAEPPPQIHVEYLDAKRNPNRAYLDQVDSLMQHKLRQLRFDLILVSDNEALAFALRHREQLFPQVPIVFCGISPAESGQFTAAGNITGVEEVPSFGETIDLALQLHPGTRELIFLGRTDDPSEALTRTLLGELAGHYANRMRFSFWDDLAAPALETALEQLSPGQLVFRLGSIKDQSGRAWSFAESSRFVRQHTAVPQYGFYENALGHGIVGGKLVSANNQGRLAAQLGLRILSGEAPETISVVSTDSNPYLFDDRELRRFDIRSDQLPEGSLRLFQDPAFYPMHKSDFWILFGLFAGLCAVAALLAWNIRVRRNTEQALRESEERLRLALEGSQDGLWDWDATTGRNIVDERWCAMLGYTKAEIREDIEQWAELVHPEDLPLISAAHLECVEGRTTHFAGEFRMRTKAGEWKWILGRGTVVTRSADGRPLRLTGTHKDISGQKATEQALQTAVAAAESARDKIDAILKSISDGLIVTDTGGQVLLINDAARRLLDLGSQAVIGRRIGELIAAPAYAAQLQQILGQGEAPVPIDLELHQREHGELRVLKSRACLMQKQEGGRGGIITILQDVTRLRDMDRMKSEFIATAAHELRTPLAAVLGFTELLLQEGFNREQQREFLTIIEERAQTLTNIVDELLDLSRIESGRLMALDRSLCSLDDLIPPLVAQYRLAASRHRFEIVLDSAPGELWVDRGKIGQVLENLLSNAVKYSPAGGTIRVSAHQAAGQVEVTVSDQGIGMTTAQVERIFDKFYRADTGNTAIGGLGLGMAIARNIVEAHTGRIWVDSTPGKGTRVSFTLPLAGG